MSEELGPVTGAFTRRTLAKTAAWVAPAVLMSTAVPAFAASPVSTGTIRDDASSYSLVSLEEMTITGVVTPTGGGLLPPDMVLTASVGAGYTVVSQPVLTGTTFTLKIKAPNGATTGSLTVQSTNYLGYVKAVSSLVSHAPGMLDTTVGLMPLAKNWVRAGDSNGIRWYVDNTGTTALTAGQINTRLYDLRFAFAAGGPSQVNFGATPFLAPATTGGYPSANSMMTNTTTTVLQATVAGVNHTDAATAATVVSTSIGATTGLGNFSMYGAVNTTVPYMPNRDAAGGAVANNGAYILVPTVMPKGAMAYVNVVQTVIINASKTVSMGFSLQYSRP